MSKLSASRLECLRHYSMDAHPDERIRFHNEGWSMRQANWALGERLLKVGEGGWHILTDRGAKALADAERTKADSQALNSIEQPHQSKIPTQPQGEGS